MSEYNDTIKGFVDLVKTAPGTVWYGTQIWNLKQFMDNNFKNLRQTVEWARIKSWTIEQKYWKLSDMLTQNLWAYDKKYMDWINAHTWKIN